MDSVKEKILTDYILKYKGEFSFEEIKIQLTQHNFTSEEVKTIYDKVCPNNNSNNLANHYLKSNKNVKVFTGIFISIIIVFLVWSLFFSGEGSVTTQEKKVSISELLINDAGGLSSITIHNFEDFPLENVSMFYGDNDCNITPTTIDIGIINLEFNSSKCAFVDGEVNEILIKSNDNLYSLEITP